MDKPPTSAGPRFTTLVSLGSSCQTAYQAARFAASRDDVAISKGPIDWLICPIDRLNAWFERDLDAPRRFWFWHGYMSKSEENGHTVRRLAIDDTWDREQEKFAHQRAVMRSVHAHRTLFVWSNAQNNLDRSRVPDGVYEPEQRDRYALSADSRERLASALSKFLGAPPHILFVSTKERDADAADVLVEAGASEWKGEDASWDAVLERALAPL